MNINNMMMNSMNRMTTVTSEHNTTVLLKSPNKGRMNNPTTPLAESSYPTILSDNEPSPFSTPMKANPRLFSSSPPGSVCIDMGFSPMAEDYSLASRQSPICDVKVSFGGQESSVLRSRNAIENLESIRSALNTMVSQSNSKEKLFRLSKSIDAKIGNLPPSLMLAHQPFTVRPQTVLNFSGEEPKEPLKPLYSLVWNNEQQASKSEEENDALRLRILSSGPKSHSVVFRETDFGQKCCKKPHTKGFKQCHTKWSRKNHHQKRRRVAKKAKKAKDRTDEHRKKEEDEEEETGNGDDDVKVEVKEEKDVVEELEQCSLWDYCDENLDTMKKEEEFYEEEAARLERKGFKLPFAMPRNVRDVRIALCMMTLLFEKEKRNNQKHHEEGDDEDDDS